MDNTKTKLPNEIKDIIEDIVLEKKHLRMLLFTQSNHRHRAEEWDWAIEKSRNHLSELSDQLFDKSEEYGITDEVFATLASILQREKEGKL